MELIISLAIGCMVGAGVWLVLRPRTFQVLIGLSLLSYAVNLFIFSAGGLALDKQPIIQNGLAADLTQYADPLPQALVLTAIVIGFAGRWSTWCRTERVPGAGTQRWRPCLSRTQFRAAP